MSVEPNENDNLYLNHQANAEVKSGTHDSDSNINHSYFNADIITLIIFIVVVIIVTGSKTVQGIINDYISKKYFRWIFSGVILPAISFGVASLISLDNQKFVYIATIIVSLVLSEWASVLSAEKSNEELISVTERLENDIDQLKSKHVDDLSKKDVDISRKNTELREVSDELSRRVNELRQNYLHRLYEIASDHLENDCVSVKLKVKEVAQDIMATSGLLLSMDGVDYQTRNNQVPLPQESSVVYENAMKYARYRSHKK